MCTEHCHINRDACVVKDLFVLAIRIDRQKANLGSTSWPFFRSCCKLSMNSWKGSSWDKLIPASAMTRGCLWEYRSMESASLILVSLIDLAVVELSPSLVNCFFLTGLLSSTSASLQGAVVELDISSNVAP